MIDTVDVVSHDSYRRLLEQKDILLERLVAPSNVLKDEPEPRNRVGDRPAVQEVSDGQGTLELMNAARIVDGDLLDNTTAFLISELGKTIEGGKQEALRAGQFLKADPNAPTIRFPRRELKYIPPKFSLSYVTDQQAKTLGAIY